MSSRAERSAPVPLPTLCRIPSGTCKLYVLAAADGRAMNSRGNYDPLMKGERQIGVRVAQVHRDRVLAYAGVKLRQWQDATRRWADLGLAHRCAKGLVFLLVQPPAGDRCPECNARLECASTRSENVHDAQSERASYVQTGGPSTGTQRGEVPEEVLEEDVQEIPSEDGLAAIAARRKFQEDYYGPGYKSYMDKGDLPLDADIDEHSEVS